MGRLEKGWGWIGRNCWSVWCWFVKFGIVMLVGKIGLWLFEEDDFCVVCWFLVLVDCFVVYFLFLFFVFGEIWDNNKLFFGWVVEDFIFWKIVLEIFWGEGVWIIFWIFVFCFVGVIVFLFFGEVIL